MTIWVNGVERDLPAGATVADAIGALVAPLDGRGVAAAVDGEVVPRAHWDQMKLEDGSRVEVVRAVQGG